MVNDCFSKFIFTFFYKTKNALVSNTRAFLFFFSEVGDLFGQERLTCRHEHDQVFQAIALCFSNCVRCDPLRDGRWLPVCVRSRR